MANDATSSTPASFRLRWDVFLSFRGEDTRHTIIESLYKALYQNGIRVFRDNDGLNRGDEIAPSLIDAIYDSAASIIILSPRYGNSKWCLKELAKICQLNRLILPVFYGVDPSDVRRQQGPFKEDFERHEKRFAAELVLEWRNAMEKVGGIAGWVFNVRDQGQLVQILIKRVLAELGNTPMKVAAYTVGLDSRVEEVMRLLFVKSNGVLVLGLHGIGGVGKTTLAKAVYNKIVGQFEARSFISNVREISGKHNGLISLQEKLIADLSRNNMRLIANEVSANIETIKDIAFERKVVIVLDDVGHESQLNALCGEKEWFSEGSRIIITTRDTAVLVENHVNQLYEVQKLDFTQALQLFSYHALRREEPKDEFLSLSKQIVSLTGELPLALEVFGSFLFDKRRIIEWEDALGKLRNVCPVNVRSVNVQNVLKISFDGLDEHDKCIFLDIACLFVGMNMKRDEAIDILKGCGFRAELAIAVLTAKSLIKVKDDTLWMHDQIRDMGRQIVQEESPVDPGKRSRLWARGEIMTMLRLQKGTRNIQGIVLDFEKKTAKDSSASPSFWEIFLKRPSVTSAITYLNGRYMKCLQHRTTNEQEVVLRTKPFKSMVSLRLLQINYVKLEGSFKFLPADLKWLQWKDCRMKALPSDFFPSELAVLDLSESGIERVWGSYTNKVAKNLKVMNLRGCWNLATIPDLSKHQILEKLVLERCKRLTEIHESVGNISTLLHLNLRECTNLVEFPSDVSGLKHLENLILSGCSKLKELPEDMGSMRSLKELLLDGTAIEKLPKSIFRLEKLEKLNLSRCQFLKRLPEYIGKLDALKELSLDHSAIEELPDSVGNLGNVEILSLIGCRSITAIPVSIGNLKSLIEFLIDGTAVKDVPASIGSLSYLKVFSVGNCKSLSTLPESIEGLACVVELQLDGTMIRNLPDQIGGLKMLDKLALRNCTSLETLPQSIGSILTLTRLNMHNANIIELPESIGMLENLVMLRLNKCRQLQKLPDAIGKLKSLVHLLMEETAVTELPESFGMLSSLMVLKMAKRPLFRMPENSRTMETRNLSTQKNPKLTVLPTSFSNLSLLQELDARAWKICGKIPDDFEKLSSLKILNLGNNNFCSLPSSMRGLSLLEKLLLPYCQELESLPPLPSSLEEVNVANCFALESIHDLSNLQNLQELNLTNCEKVVDIPGLECLKSLKRLYLSCCNACSSVVKQRLSKVRLKNLRNLSMPGSKIPDWFTPEMITYSAHRNRKIKGVIIGVVVSLDHQVPDELRYQLPAVVDIQAEILTPTQTIHMTVLNLMGVPKTNEDQVHLCRYPAFHPLVSTLEDGYRIRVKRRNQPMVGVELKKSGIYLVYENDDDYCGDEESLDESQQTVSKKLATFFGSFQADDHQV
ncbi:Disease resistance protein [Melia azedarach]|uniref:Disease resistance protein n=1 Tax=Melia azedarach TaxID=155640 RepID=A0ACC1Y6N8_MELAZ|nr:Disease resistance protein [Melia azedarach]